jgi:hypothetical protein
VGEQRSDNSQSKDQDAKRQTSEERADGRNSAAPTQRDKASALSGHGQGNDGPPGSGANRRDGQNVGRESKHERTTLTEQDTLTDKNIGTKDPSSQKPGSDVRGGKESTLDQAGRALAGQGSPLRPDLSKAAAAYDAAKEKLTAAYDASKENLTQAAGTTKEKLTEAAGTTKEKLTEAAGVVKDAATKAGDTAKTAYKAMTGPVPDDKGNSTAMKIVGGALQADRALGQQVHGRVVDAVVKAAAGPLGEAAKIIHGVATAEKKTQEAKEANKNLTPEEKTSKGAVDVAKQIPIVGTLVSAGEKGMESKERFEAGDTQGGVNKGLQAVGEVGLTVGEVLLFEAVGGGGLKGAGAEAGAAKVATAEAGAAKAATAEAGAAKVATAEAGAAKAATAPNGTNALPPEATGPSTLRGLGPEAPAKPGVASKSASDMTTPAAGSETKPGGAPESVAKGDAPTQRPPEAPATQPDLGKTQPDLGKTQPDLGKTQPDLGKTDGTQAPKGVAAEAKAPQATGEGYMGKEGLLSPKEAVALEREVLAHSDKPMSAELHTKYDAHIEAKSRLTPEQNAEYNRAHEAAFGKPDAPAGPDTPGARTEPGLGPDAPPGGSAGTESKPLPEAGPDGRRGADRNPRDGELGPNGRDRPSLGKRD